MNTTTTVTSKRRAQLPFQHINNHLTSNPKQASTCFLEDEFQPINTRPQYSPKVSQKKDRKISEVSISDQTCESLDTSIHNKSKTDNCKKSNFSNSNKFEISKKPDYAKKFKTELCKNFDLTGNCQWGDSVN